MPSGSCLCGDIVYEYTGESALTALCHCHACQKWSGSTASSNVLLKKDQFKLVKGTPKVFTMPGDSGKSKFRNFCANCGSCLFGELEILPGMIGLKAGTLDEGAADYRTVQTEFYTEARVSFCKPLDGAKQEPKFGN